MAVGGSGGGGSSGGIRAGRAFVELYANDAGLRGALARAQAGVRAASRVFLATGAAVAGASGTAFGAIGAVFKGAVDRGAEFQSLQQRLGGTVEELSAFVYAAESTGQSLEDLGGHYENLAERILQAKSGTGEAAEAFRAVGLSADEMLAASPANQFKLMSAAMKDITNDTQRRGLLSGFMGDAGQGMNELLKKGPEGIQALMDRAKDDGAVVSTENAQRAAQVSSAWNRAYAVVKNSILSVGEALLPQADVIARVVKQISEAGQVVRAWVAENRQLIAGVNLGVIVFGAFGAALFTAGIALGAAAAAAAGFASAASVAATVATYAVSSLLTPIVLIPAAVVAAEVAWLAFTESGRASALEMGESVRGVAMRIAGQFGDTAANVSASWKLVMDAVGRGDIRGVFQVTTAAMRTEWARLTLWMTRRWIEFRNAFEDGWRGALQRGEDELDVWGAAFKIVTVEANEAVGGLFGDIVEWNQFLSDTIIEVGRQMLNILAQVHGKILEIINSMMQVREGAGLVRGGPPPKAEPAKPDAGDKIANDAARKLAARQAERDKTDAARKRSRDEADAAAIASQEANKTDAERAQRFVAMQQAWRQAWADANREAAKQGGGPAANAIASAQVAARGFFGGDASAQAFGVGRSTAAEKQLTELQQVNENLKAIEMKLTGNRWK